MTPERKVTREEWVDDERLMRKDLADAIAGVPFELLSEVERAEVEAGAAAMIEKRHGCPCPPEPAPEWKAGCYQLEASGGFALMSCDDKYAYLLDAENLDALIDTASKLRDALRSEGTGR